MLQHFDTASDFEATCETASNFADYFRRYGAEESQDVHCAPVFGSGYRSELSRVQDVAGPDHLRATAGN
jgi:hypothetical protein